METIETTTIPKTISVADFTAFNVRGRKMFEDKNEQEIISDLSKMSDTHVLHSITVYGVSSKEVKEYTKPFEPNVEQSSKYIKDGERFGEA